MDGPRIPGVPADAQGFLVTDGHGAVRGAPGVYAAGDGTANPIKQGGLATQQADAIAEAIAAEAGAPCEPTPFTPRLQAQLFTGALPWFLRGGRDDAHPVATRAALWSPGGKVAARYLTPYLATRETWGLGEHPTLRSHEAAASDPDEKAAIRDLALILADDEAESGHRDAALHWLEIAEDTGGVLPPDYVRKRRRWTSGSVPR
jgi:sulfide:quinone oxidoreductase